MKRLKKVQVTLIELVISLTLTAFVLSALMFFFREVNELTLLAEKEQNESFQQRYLESRLMTVIPRISERSRGFLQSEGGSAAHYLDNNPHLFFIFDNGANIDRLFAHEVLARLFVDRDGFLTLALWPMPKRWPDGEEPPMKKEILASEVTGISFSFYVAPKRDRSRFNSDFKKVNRKQVLVPAIMEPEPRGEWIDQWNANYGELPALIKIRVKQKSGDEMLTRDYVYPLANCNQFIVYED